MRSIPGWLAAGKMAAWHRLSSSTDSLILAQAHWSIEMQPIYGSRNPACSLRLTFGKNVACSLRLTIEKDVACSLRLTSGKNVACSLRLTYGKDVACSLRLTYEKIVDCSLRLICGKNIACSLRLAKGKDVACSLRLTCGKYGEWGQNSQQAAEESFLLGLPTPRNPERQRAFLNIVFFSSSL